MLVTKTRLFRHYISDEEQKIYNIDAGFNVKQASVFANDAHRE
jgi:hypothetical protein